MANISLINRISKMMDSKISKPTLKKMKKVTIATIAGLAATAALLGATIALMPKGETMPEPTIQIETEAPTETETRAPELETESATSATDVDAEQDKQLYFPELHKDTMTAEQKRAYNQLKQVASKKLETREGAYGGVEGFLFVEEEDVVRVSKELSVAIKDYFKTYGASDWTNPAEQQFWPEDVEYLVAAIAWRETEYRTNTKNEETNCAGMLGLHESLLLKTFTHGNWLTDVVWGEHIPYIDCDAERVDVYNPVQSLEYTYYNIGYNLANRLKNDKIFYDDKTETRIGVWQKLEYTEEMQNRLIIASHLFGINNVVDSVFERNYDDEQKRYISLDEYIYSDYVEDVLNKYYELVDTYETQNAFGR